MSNRTEWDVFASAMAEASPVKAVVSVEELSAQQRITPIDRLLGTPMGPTLEFEELGHKSG